MFQSKTLATGAGCVLVCATLLFAPGVNAQNAPSTDAATPSASLTPTITTADQASQSAETSVGTTTVETETVIGELTTINGNQLTVKTDADTRQLTIDSDIAITRDGSTANREDLRTTDNVTATIARDGGQVLSLEATSADSAAQSSLLVPGIIIALVVLALIYYLLKKRGSRHIKTTTSHVG